MSADEPRYRRLLVWKKAHNNAIILIALIKNCNSKYGRVIDQCLGSVTSIGANIAEGNESATHKQKESYFQISLNSAYELDNWLQILKDGEIITDKEKIAVIEKENIEVIKILCTIIKSLRS
ncbi:MAG: four helix bundle protein [Candidatus Omnitrophota bacterium]